MRVLCPFSSFGGLSLLVYGSHCGVNNVRLRLWEKSVYYIYYGTHHTSYKRVNNLCVVLRLQFGIVKMNPMVFSSWFTRMWHNSHDLISYSCNCIGITYLTTNIFMRVLLYLSLQISIYFCPFQHLYASPIIFIFANIYLNLSLSIFVDIYCICYCQYHNTLWRMCRIPMS